MTWSLLADLPLLDLQKFALLLLPLELRNLHEKVEDFSLQLIAGASAGYQVDDELVAAMCDKWRALY
jgi:hypothetical protein